MAYIWCEKEEKYSFVEFIDNFVYISGKAQLYVSASFNYATYINGKFVVAGQYADTVKEKVIDEIDVTSYLKTGKNEIKLICYHMGNNHQVCSTIPAGVEYYVKANGEKIVESTKNTESRISATYVSADNITPQLGKVYEYFTGKEDCGEKQVTVEKPLNFNYTLRPIKKTQYIPTCPLTFLAQGAFKWNGGKLAGEKMQYAYLSPCYFTDITGLERTEHDKTDRVVTFKLPENLLDADGVYNLIDIGKESAGYVDFTVTVPKACTMYMGWGEHLTDLRIRTTREERSFACKINLQAGENKFSDRLIRLGCRYICFYTESSEITFNNVTFVNEVYPLNRPKKDFGDRLLNSIYEMGRDTLQLCMHAHYEDCPWREQALYGMDSRNQILFGYGAFNEYEFPRASISLLARNIDEEGLVQLSAPAEMSITIPSFTIYTIMEFVENVQADFNQKFIDDNLPYVRKMLKAFTSRINGGVINTFSEPRYWNFHEWKAGLDGGEIFRDYCVDSEPDALTTALTYIATQKMIWLESNYGDKAEAERLSEILKTITFEPFFDEKKNCYASYISKTGFKGYHIYTQSAILLSGNVTEERKKRLIELLKNPGDLTEITLGALQTKYQALCENGEIDWVIENICEIFGGMMFSGCTSFWETQLGEADFNGAGSLCHGWAAVACYVLDNYYKKK